MQNNSLFSFENVKFYLKHEFLIELTAAAMMALGIRVFAAPNMIVSGGVSGISSVLFVLFGLPIGVTSFLINLPLLLLGWRKLGHRFIIRTLRMVALTSLAIDIIFARIPPYYGEKLLVSLFAGLFLGIGLGLVLMRGDSTGGTDI
ncbi:MAG: YitT family protein, partial [Oscillospiraceae bacterium]|nr:YitT family protein [Oscillospiraceae bacterium]